MGDQMKSEGLGGNNMYDVFQSRKTAFLASITHLIEISGFVPGSVQRRGSYQWGDGFYPGLNWSYLPIAHLASTAWSGMALLMDDAFASNKNVDVFNVLAAQKNMISRAEAQAQCTNIKQTLAKCN